MRKIVYLVLSLFALSISASADMDMTDASETSDSLKVIDYSGLSNQFRLIPDSTLYVKEHEVRAGLLYDVENKKIVWQKNMNNAYPMASLTKMMVALLAVEDVNAGKFTWEDNVKWTRQYYVGRRRHKKLVSSQVNYTLRDVFKAAMIASNNECSEQMARYIGYGDLQATIDRMNQRARELGMLSTYYGNPTGLPSPNWMFDNASSPTDLLLLALEMLKYQEVIDITKMGYASIENGKMSSVIRNHNHLTIDYPGEVDGLKTGYTKRAGFCLVSTTAKCDHRLVSIVLGCRGPQIRNEVVRDMFNGYYAKIGLDPLGPYCPAPIMPPLNPSAQQNTNPNDYVVVSDVVRKSHRVKSGETVSSISRKYKCSTGDIKNWNKKALRNGLQAGESLVVYAKVTKKIPVTAPANGSETEDDQPLANNPDVKADDKDTAAPAETVIKTQSSTQPVAVRKSNPQPKKTTSNQVVIDKKYIIHTVEPGDTLFSIAQRYQGVTVTELKTLNRIRNIHNLKPGMKLKVKVDA